MPTDRNPGAAPGTAGRPPRGTIVKIYDEKERVSEQQLSNALGVCHVANHFNRVSKVTAIEHREHFVLLVLGNVEDRLDVVVDEQQLAARVGVGEVRDHDVGHLPRLCDAPLVSTEGRIPWASSRSSALPCSA